MTNNDDSNGDASDVNKQQKSSCSDNLPVVRSDSFPSRTEALEDLRELSGVNKEQIDCTWDTIQAVVPAIDNVIYRQCTSQEAIFYWEYEQRKTLMLELSETENGVKKLKATESGKTIAESVDDLVEEFEVIFLRNLLEYSLLNDL